MKNKNELRNTEIKESYRKKVNFNHIKINEENLRSGDSFSSWHDEG